jgi:trk system potassium uptake protein TrkH
MERENIPDSTSLHAKRILWVYLGLTLMGIIILKPFGVAWFDSVLHVLSGISTGGFSAYKDSLAGFGSWTVSALLILIALLGAMPLTLYHPAYFKGWRGLFTHIELRGLLTTGLIFIGFLTLCMHFVGQLSWETTLHNAPLLALSAQTTVGFSSMEVATLDPASKLTLILAMFIGGGVGSTAGGIKILRLLVLLRLLHLLFLRTCLPADAVVKAKLDGHTLDAREIEHILLLILLFILIILVSWSLFVAYGYAPLDALFEVVSAIATVGLTTGISGPDLPLVLQAVLCLDMLLGRLEVVALLLILYPRTWVNRRTE